LTLKADGSYSYELNNANSVVQGLNANQSLTEVFSYVITDADKDTSPSQLTITINGTNDGVTITGLDNQGPEVTVNEANLADGSSPDAAALTKTGSFSFSALDGTDDVSIGSTALITNGVYAGDDTVVTTAAYGTLTITGFTPVTDGTGAIIGGTFTYEYLLDDNTLTHASGQGINSLTESLTVTVTDTDSDTDTAILDIKVIDDIPTAAADTDSVQEDGPSVVATGNVLTGVDVSLNPDSNSTDGVADTQGADTATVTAVTFGQSTGTVGSELAGLYGTLTLKADGSYSYELNNANSVVQGLNANQSLTEVFSYVITDADKDTSPSQLTITINGTNDGVTITGLDNQGPEVTVNEANLADGSSPDAAALTKTGSFSFSALDGTDDVSIGSTALITNGVYAGDDTVVTTAAYGTLTITGFTPVTDGTGAIIGGTFTYEYLLDDNTLTHASGQGINSLTESLTVTVTDTDSDTDTAILDIKVIDDIPTAAADTDSVQEDGPSVVATGNVLTGVDVSLNPDSNSTDGVADTQGADTATVTAVTFGQSTGTVGSELAGLYGTSPSRQMAPTPMS
ncbi:VCBS domain-containing protein, partial [Cyanobium sp. ATX-6F1]|uniref:VCBS domain-containing protein n=1 Tax=Cyanobium sp. ATX-6F1 TaxID=3137388 RepID=UPI0039BE6705